MMEGGFCVGIILFSVVLWSLAKNNAICGSPAQIPSAGIARALAYSSMSDDMFFTGGE